MKSNKKSCSVCFVALLLLFTIFFNSGAAYAACGFPCGYRRCNDGWLWALGGVVLGSIIANSRPARTIIVEHPSPTRTVYVESPVVVEKPVVVERVVEKPVVVEKVVEKPVVVEKTVVKEVYLPSKRVIQGNPTIIRENDCPIPESSSSAKYCGCNTESGRYRSGRYKGCRYERKNSFYEYSDEGIEEVHTIEKIFKPNGTTVIGDVTRYRYM